MEIYNTDTDQLEYYNGTTWEVVGDKLVVQTNSALTDAVDFDPPNKVGQYLKQILTSPTHRKAMS